MTSIYYKDRSLIFPQIQTAVITDIHFSSELSNEDFESIQSRIQKIITTEEIDQFIFLGDIFNEYPFSDQGIEVIKNIQNNLNTIFFILGNHEEKVGGLLNEVPHIVEKQEIYLRSEEQTYCLLHGHKEPRKSADTYIIGHLHPHCNTRPCAIKLKDQYNSSDVIILPAFYSSENKNTDLENSPLVTDGSKFTIEKQF